VITIKCSHRSRKFYRALPEKDRRIVVVHIRHLLEYPDIRADIECIDKTNTEQIWRMHVSRKYTIIYTVFLAGNEIHVDDLMTIEQVHKKYDR
jgi:mRNA interferase RelE/StbE